MAISYPVEPNSRWAIYDTDTATVIRTNARWPRADGMEIVGKADNLVPLLEVREEQPVFDSATEKLVAVDPVADVGANTYTYGWSVVALTQAEIDAIAARDQHNTDADIAKAVYSDLKNSVGT